METLTDIIIVTRDPIQDKFEGSSLFKSQCTIDSDKNETERGVLMGRVKVVGPDVKTLMVGDHIMYHRSNYVPLEHDGEDFAVFRVKEVLAVIDDDGHMPV